MAIAGLIGMSSVYALARSTKVQFGNNVRAQLVDFMRGQIQANGVALCDTTKPVVVGQASYDTKYTCTPYANATVALPGLAAIPVTIPTTQAQIITGSVTSPAIDGTLTVSAK